MPDGFLEQHTVCSSFKSDVLNGCEGVALVTMLTGFSLLVMGSTAQPVTTGMST